MTTYFRNLTILMAATILSLTVSNAYSFKDEAGNEKQAESKKTEKKEKIESTGIFEAENMEAVELKAEYWTNYKITKVVGLGEKVSKGDVLVEFDPEDLDKKIKELEEAKKLSDLSFQKFELSVKLAEESFETRIKTAERRYKEVVEDHNYFMKVSLPTMKKSAEFDLKWASYSLESARDNLKQLKQMYKEDDVTEESEKIVLKRYETSLKNAEFKWESAKQNYDKSMKVVIPRKVNEWKESLRKDEEAWKKARVSIPNDLEEQKIKLKKMIKDRKKAAEDLANLKKDRKITMSIKAPADGYVYFGSCVKGKWDSSKSFSGKLIEGGYLKNKDVFMTIVKPGNMFIRTTFKESQLNGLSVGLEGTVSSVAFPKNKFKASIKKLAFVPITQGVYEAIVEMDESSDFGKIMPGMSAKISFELNE